MAKGFSYFQIYYFSFSQPKMIQYYLVVCALLATANCQVVRVITIDGGWSPWSTVSTPCMRNNSLGISVNVSCGGGEMLQRRSCSNPRPQGIKSKSCEGPMTTSVACNTNPCDMQWAPWSNCSAVCGRGMRRRFTLCASDKGAPLVSCKTLGLASQDFDHIQECNTWDKQNCPSPCKGYNCQEFASCVDLSTEEDPVVQCVCQMAKVSSVDKMGNDICIVPPPTTPTPRPNPTMEPVAKTATTAASKSACTLLIIFVGLTLGLFAWLKVYDHARIIQMNMEIALILAHICLIFPAMFDYPQICRIQSILIHFFFTACFMFMFLESLHTYSIVAFVVKKNGILTKNQNLLLGWGVSLAITFIIIGLCYEDYGGQYHCWLQMDKPVLFGQLVPIAIMASLTFTLIEAAGAADYRRLPGMDQQQLFSAKIMQRTILVIMPLVFASFIVGVVCEYEQNVALYGTFTILNGFLGVSIFFFHSTGNEQVREKLSGVYNVIFKKDI